MRTPFFFGESLSNYLGVLAWFYKTGGLNTICAGDITDRDIDIKECMVQLDELVKLGEHLICDLSDCDPAVLFDSERAITLFNRAIRDSGLTVVSEGSYQFSPHGFTCFLLLAESHASLHAWPEYGYCAVDLFTCNLHMDLTPLLEHLQAVFGCKQISIRTIDRIAVISEVKEPA